MYKGIEKNQNYTWIICATQNMKNIAKKLTKIWDDSPQKSKLMELLTYCTNFTSQIYNFSFILNKGYKISIENFTCEQI